MARAADNDPLEKFRFQVSVSFTSGGFSRLGFHDIQMPKRSTNKIMYREGHQPDVSMLSSGLSSFEDITMSRGILAKEAIGLTGQDDFRAWASRVLPQGVLAKADLSQASSPTEYGVNEYRAEVTVTMLSREGKPARTWKLYNCFPTNYVPGSDLNASEDGEKSIQTLTLAYENFEEITPPAV
jgi:phage tail-like protein